MGDKHWVAWVAVAAGLAAARAEAPVTAPRTYVFDNGAIAGLDPALFNFRREEFQESISWTARIRPFTRAARTTGRVPTFEFDAEKSRVSRERVERFLEANDATLWIEHDRATHTALPKPPAYVD